MTDRRSGLQRFSALFEAGRWPVVALLAVCIARLWLVPLPSSFWVDELVTLFVVKHPGHASFAIAPQVPQSIYYWLPRMAMAVTGPSEVGFRIPSMIAMGIALWLVGLIAARLIHPRAAWFAVFTALSLRGIDYFALDARPYALGIMACAGCLYFLIRWLDSARWGDAAAFVFFAALLWRVHLIYWPFYLVIAIYAITRFFRGETAPPWFQWVVVALATMGSLIAPALNALELARAAQSHVFVQIPTLHAFEHELHWNVPLICAGLVWILAKFAPPRDAVRPSAWILILSWWLCQPVVIYLYSHLSANSVFVGRYLSVLLPAVALMTTAAVACWLPPDRWRVAAGLMAVAALLFQGHPAELSFRHDISDWRAAAHEVNAFASDRSTPVLTPSPFVEARPPAWSPGYPLPGFLYAHLDGYAVAGTDYLLPFDSPPKDSTGVDYAEQLMRVGKLAATGKFAIYGPERHVNDWSVWFSERPELANWSSELLTFGDVYVAEFRRR